MRGLLTTSFISFLGFGSSARTPRQPATQTSPDPPLSPEENLPADITIEALETLINQLQDKAGTIRNYIRVLERKSEQGQKIDLASYSKSLKSAKKTHTSITALQKVLKSKKFQDPERQRLLFPQVFVDMAAEDLPPDVYQALMDKAKERVRQFCVGETPDA